MRDNDNGGRKTFFLIGGQNPITLDLKKVARYDEKDETQLGHNHHGEGKLNPV